MIFGKYEPEESKDTLRRNDFVRIHRWKTKFEKNFAPNWTREVFRIYKVNPTKPITYILTDRNGEVIEGAFYRKQLLRISHEILKMIL